MQAQDQKLVSIERVVAFVLGPIVVAASGTLSAYAVKWGFEVTPAEVEAAFATGGVTAGGLVWKWLHGRQLAEKATVLEGSLGHGIGTLPGVDGFIHTTLTDLEGLAQSAAERAASAVTKLAPGGATATATTATATTESPPQEQPIPAAADPAPASQDAPAPQDGAAADVGAASGQ